jgi:Ca2+-binding RTX toxin-like protein
MVDIAANTTTTAAFEGSSAVMATFSGELETFGDKDWIKVTLVAGGTYQFFGSVDSPGFKGGDSVITLRDASGAVIASMSNDNDPNYDGATLNSYLKYTAPATGTYFVEIGSTDARPGEYSVAVMFNQARVRLSNLANSYSGADNAVIVGDDGDDGINLSNASIAALGEQGDDSILGNAFDNRLSGGLGDDYLNGVAGNDRLFGDAGFDWLYGNVGDDLLYGGPGADELDGWLDNDIIFGGEGADLCKGGAGDDIFHVDSASDVVRELVGEGTDTVLATVSYTLTSGAEIEFLQAEVQSSTAALNLTGSAYANTIIGNNGVNVLNGGDGNDTLRGLLGNDVYVLGSGSDAIVDTGGVDTLTTTVTRRLSAYGTVENAILVGTAANTALEGNALANVLTGNDASNVLRGVAGSDTLRGMGGNDYVLGEAGRDVSTGGLGNDQFFYLAASDSPVGANADLITDFDDFGNDLIDLDSVYSGHLTYRHNLAFTAPGQVRINDIAGADVIVEVNTAGGLGADMQIRLAGTSLSAMAANDFVL